MPIQFQCSSCRSTLQVPDNLAGRKVRCPKCRGVADVSPLPAGAPPASVAAPALATEDKASPGLRPDSDELRVRARKPTPPPEPDVEDAEEVEVRPSKPVRSPSRRQEAIATRPIRRHETTEEDEEEEDAPRPRRLKRRKRKRPQGSILPAGWGFIRWVAVTLVYLMIGTGYAAHMITKGKVAELILDAIEWGIMMPISMALFFLSMIIGSAIAGGIDFGDIKTAIPKAFYLLAPINLFQVVCDWYIGSFFSLPIWVFGLILLFGLDVWESWFIIIINWLLNTGASILVILMVVALMLGQMSKDLGKDKGSPDDSGDDQMAVPAQKDQPKSPARLRR